MKNRYQHNYLKTILAQHRRGQLPQRGRWVVRVYHDDWCGAFRGGGCNCQSEIKIEPAAISRPSGYVN